MNIKKIHGSKSNVNEQFPFADAKAIRDLMDMSISNSNRNAVQTPSQAYNAYGHLRGAQSPNSGDLIGQQTGNETQSLSSHAVGGIGGVHNNFIYSQYGGIQDNPSQAMFDQSYLYDVDD